MCETVLYTLYGMSSIIREERRRRGGRTTRVAGKLKPVLPQCVKDTTVRVSGLVRLAGVGKSFRPFRSIQDYSIN